MPCPPYREFSPVEFRYDRTTPPNRPSGNSFTWPLAPNEDALWDWNTGSETIDPFDFTPMTPISMSSMPTELDAESWQFSRPNPSEEHRNCGSVANHGQWSHRLMPQSSNFTRNLEWFPRSAQAGSRWRAGAERSSTMTSMPTVTSPHDAEGQNFVTTAPQIDQYHQHVWQNQYPQRNCTHDQMQSCYLDIRMTICRGNRRFTF
ncbi:hypothetical protein BDZ91DRAFT_802595 [Kalaharituber pfeilii]|nr:hypothetical protein BDZ91DRAFT_802595 [Kalaharituber pfeilii]